MKVTKEKQKKYNNTHRKTDRVDTLAEYLGTWNITSRTKKYVLLRNTETKEKIRVSIERFKYFLKGEEAEFTLRCRKFLEENCKKY